MSDSKRFGISFGIVLAVAAMGLLSGCITIVRGPNVRALPYEERVRIAQENHDAMLREQSFWRAEAAKPAYPKPGTYRYQRFMRGSSK